MLSVGQHPQHVVKSRSSGSTFQRIEHRLLNIDSFKKTARSECASDGQRMNSISRTNLKDALTGAGRKRSQEAPWRVGATRQVQDPT
jgi:hypothetical protein